MKRRIWTCCICGHGSAWSQGWEWYGSIRVEEDCGHVLATCSDKCRSNPRMDGKIREFEKAHPTGGRCKA